MVRWHQYLFLINIILATVLMLLPRDSHPDSYRIENFPTVSQPDEITCGPTSLLMCLRHFGVNVELDEVKAKTKTEWFTHNRQHIGMTSPDYISKTFRQYGIPATVRRSNIDNLKHEVSRGRPVIVLVRSSKTTWHYVVVIGFSTTFVTVADPAGGRIWDMETKAFSDSWAFLGDMRGRPAADQCSICNGTGHWMSANLGPLSICEVCSGTGKKIDVVGILLSTADVYPNTMIIPAR